MRLLTRCLFLLTPHVTAWQPLDAHAVVLAEPLQSPDVPAVAVALESVAAAREAVLATYQLLQEGRKCLRAVFSSVHTNRYIASNRMNRVNPRRVICPFS